MSPKRLYIILTIIELILYPLMMVFAVLELFTLAWITFAMFIAICIIQIYLLTKF